MRERWPVHHTPWPPTLLPQVGDFLIWTDLDEVAVGIEGHGVSPSARAAGPNRCEVASWEMLSSTSAWAAARSSPVRDANPACP